MLTIITAIIYFPMSTNVYRSEYNLKNTMRSIGLNAVRGVGIKLFAVE